MARRFLDNVRADINALLVTGGETPAPALAALMIDIADSTINDEAAIASNENSLGIVTATSWQALTGVYDLAIGGDDDFITLDVAGGNIKTSSTAGFTYDLDGFVSFADIGQNSLVEFSVLKNGVQAGFIASLTGGGGSRPRTAAFKHTILSAGADDVFAIGVQTPNGIETIDILSIGLNCEIKPTNNP